MRLAPIILLALTASGMANDISHNPMKNEKPVWLTYKNCSAIGSFIVERGNKDGMKHVLDVNDDRLEFFNDRLIITHKRTAYIIEMDPVADKATLYPQQPYTNEDIRRVDNMIKDLLSRFEGGNPIDSSPPLSAMTDEVLRLAIEIRQLKKKKGHFTGGEWNDDVDKHGGRLFTAMDELKNRLNGLALDQNEVVKLLGEPDALRPSENGEVLIYFWRGWHDYLFFECHERQVKRIEWYFAFE